MIENIAIAGTKIDVTKELEHYVQKKVGKLDRHLKRSVRSSVRADVKLRESTSNSPNKKYTCDVILHIPGARLTASESTSNMFAAVDIVEANLQTQLRRYKEKHSRSKDKHKNKRARRRLGKFFSR